MNTYIYDSFLNHRKYDRLLAKLETRIIGLGLNGKVCRVSLTRSIDDIVKNEQRQGTKTVVAVGNNKTLNQVINSLSDNQTILGFIPIGEINNDIAKCLGINSIDGACDILSARLIARLDLGVANKTYFLSQAMIENQGTLININDNYTIETTDRGSIKLFNLPADKPGKQTRAEIIPDDGVLELAVSTKQNKKLFFKKAEPSIFKIKKITVHNSKKQLVLDGSVCLTAPVEITVAKQRLRLIVGKNKYF